MLTALAEPRHTCSEGAGLPLGKPRTGYSLAVGKTFGSALVASLPTCDADPVHVADTAAGAAPTALLVAALQHRPCKTEH